MSDSKVPEEIKARLPIEEVVGGYVPLKKAGRTYKALCPFHSEKSPSFTVNPERGIFKCFGCGEGGDIFDFVMKLEGLTFPEAVQLLAERANIPLTEWEPAKPSRKGPGQAPEIGKVRLFELNRYTASLWHQILTRHPKAEDARQYLQKRGLLPRTITDFQIGYAPFGPATAKALAQAGFRRPEIQLAGDPTRFQDRITFPITDLTGKVIGFTGRLLEIPDDPAHSGNRGPKYWNTPETPLFIKSRAVYALHLAKRAIQEQGVAILAEGQMDVIMLHQAGYHNTVASSGTALTEEQLLLLRRFTPVVAFAYDSDNAGREATKRGIALALSVELTPYVIEVPHGKDPADCIKEDPAAWETAYHNRLPAMQWIIRQLLPEGSGAGLSSEQKKRVARELVEWLARLSDPTEQADWFRTTAAYLDTNEENLRELFRRLKPRQHLAEARATATSEPITKQEGSEQQIERLGETVLALLLTFPEAYPPLAEQINKLPPEATQGTLGKVLAPILAKHNPEEPLEPQLNKLLTDAERTELAVTSETILRPYEGTDLSPAWAVTELSLILHRIRDTIREKEKARLARSIQRAQALGNREELQKLFKELQNLAKSGIVPQ